MTASGGPLGRPPREERGSPVGFRTTEPSVDDSHGDTDYFGVLPPKGGRRIMAGTGVAPAYTDD